MKKKITLILSIVGIVAGVALFLTIQNLVTAKETKTVVLSTDPKDDVKIGELVLDVVEETINITSHTYTHTFDFRHGGLEDDAGFGDKFWYALSGKRLDTLAYVDMSMTSDILQIQEDDIVYDEDTKVLTVYLPEPTMKVTYNTKTGLGKGDNKYEALFSGGYSAEEILRMPDKMVKVAEMEIPTEYPELIEEAKEDISTSFSNLLTVIEEAKEDASEKEAETLSEEEKASKEKIEKSVKELKKSVKEVDVQFKDA